MNDPKVELELFYIVDLVNEILDLLENKKYHCSFDGVNAIADDNGKYCYVPTTHKAAFGEIVELLDSFKAQPESLIMPSIPNNSFAKKLYSTYLSYLPKEKTIFPLKMNVDDRGVLLNYLKPKIMGSSLLTSLNRVLLKDSTGIIVSGNSLL